MDEKMKFVARLLEGDSMTELCQEYGISRKTGYKIWDRYQKCGVEGLVDRSRRPVRFGNQLPMQVEKSLLKLKKEKTHWGAKKIRERFIQRFSDLKTPAISTIQALFDRHGLLMPRGRKRYRAEGPSLSAAATPNDLWCADYKGEFMLGNKQYCYPLTISDFTSRFLIACEALETTKEKFAFTVFERVFLEFGLPFAIRTDNGVPFAAPNSLLA